MQRVSMQPVGFYRRCTNERKCGPTPPINRPTPPTYPLEGDLTPTISIRA